MAVVHFLGSPGDPRFGVKNGTKKQQKCDYVFETKASIFWNWAKWLLVKAAGEEVILINLDETGVGYSFPGAHGNVVKRGAWPKKRCPPTSKTAPVDPYRYGNEHQKVSTSFTSNFFGRQCKIYAQVDVFIR